MSVETRVEEWLRKMGYDGEIPTSLNKICNSSTAFVWEQLMSNIKPRQEVEHKRKSIVVSRLSKKSLEEQDEFSYPVKEIQVYVEKQKLKKRIQSLEKTIEEKGKIVDDLVKKNNITYMTINNVKAKIKENQERKFLLDKKSKLLEDNIQHVQEVYTLAKNLTPVEMEASANADEVTKTLQKCAEKLQKISVESSMPKANIPPCIMNTAKTPKYSSKSNTISQYLDQSTILPEIAPSTCKKFRESNKENINFIQHGTARCLKFSDDEVTNDKIERKPQRESLGLLPEACLDTSDDLDTFLLSNSKSENLILQPLSDSLLEEPLSKNKNYQILEKLRGDNSVKELLKDLLYKNNRYLILSQWRNIFEHLLTEMRVPIMECNKLISSSRGVSQSDLTELFFIHIKNELEKDKTRIILKKLHENVKRRKEEIFFQLCNRSRNREETRKIFELKIEEAYLSGVDNFLRKEVNAVKKFENGNEAQIVSLKIKQAKEEMVYKSQCIEALISNVYKVLEDIRTNSEETSICVKKLTPFVRDPSWANMMTESTNSQEIDTFKNFPLEYNRKFENNSRITFCKDISTSSIPSYVKFDSDELEIITKVVNLPFASAENVIWDTLRTKIVANKLQKIKVEELPDLNYHKYTKEELSKKEDYIDDVSNKLNCIINSSSVKETLASPTDIKEVTDLWLEMPFKNFISDKRQVDGHGFKYYENILKEVKNN